MMISRFCTAAELKQMKLKIFRRFFKSKWNWIFCHWESRDFKWISDHVHGTSIVMLQGAGWKEKENIRSVIMKETCWEMRHWERNCCRNSLSLRNKFFSCHTLRLSIAIFFFHAHKSGNLGWPMFFSFYFFLCYDTEWRKSRASLLYKLKSSILAFLYEILRCNHTCSEMLMYTPSLHSSCCWANIFINKSEEMGAKLQSQLLCAISDLCVLIDHWITKFPLPTSAMIFQRSTIRREKKNHLHFEKLWFLSSGMIIIKIYNVWNVLLNIFVQQITITM